MKKLSWNNKAVSKAILVVVVVVVIAVAAGVGYFVLSGRYQAPNYGQPQVAKQAATTKTTQTPSAPTQTTQRPYQTRQSPTPTQTTQPQTKPATSAPQGQRTLMITIKEWAYNGTNPNIQAKVGETILVTVKNEGSFSHTFTIDELNVNTGLISPGASKTITISATKAGSFTYYCTVDGHKSLGLKGTLSSK